MTQLEELGGVALEQYSSRRGHAIEIQDTNIRMFYELIRLENPQPEVHS